MARGVIALQDHRNEGKNQKNTNAHKKREQIDRFSKFYTLMHNYKRTTAFHEWNKYGNKLTIRRVDCMCDQIKQFQIHKKKWEKKQQQTSMHTSTRKAKSNPLTSSWDWADKINVRVLLCVYVRMSLFHCDHIAKMRKSIHNSIDFV